MARRLLPFGLALWLLVWTPSAHAQPASARSHDITIDDYFTQADIFQIALSPDTKYVAYTEGRWQQATDDRKADLWVADSEGKMRRLTSDRSSARSPRWAPDGAQVYFLANRKREAEKRPPFDGKAQVWSVAPTGGSATPITQVEGGIEAFELADNGKSLYYLSHVEAVVDDSFKDLRLKFKSIEYGHGVNRRSQIYKLNLENRRTEKLIENDWFIHEFAVAPGTGRIAMITAPDDKVVSFEGQSKVEVWDPTTRQARALPDEDFRQDAPSPYAWLERLAWSADGTALAFNAIFDAYPARIIVARSGEMQNTWKTSALRLPPSVHVKGYGSPLQWRARGLVFCFLGEEKGRVQLYQAEPFHARADARVVPLTAGDIVVEDFSLSSSAEKPNPAAMVIGERYHLPDVFLCFADKDSKQRLTKVNPQVDGWKLPRISVVQWQGARGDTVEGILETPPGYQKGQKLPLVVEIHGGPTTASYLKLQYWIYGRTLLPAKGYAVLCPNYRGSTGYGDKFTTDLIGRENDLDVEDILKGVDHLVAQGIADPDKLAVTGWSNGGYLTNCIITKTNRFKAAISGAGIVDAVMEWGSNDEPAYAMVFKQGFPWSSPTQYHKASPTYQLDKIRTPTLIHVGANDERCPPGHSRMLYRALKEYVKVPTELLVYPGEGHGLMKYSNRRAKLEWDLAWLDRHVMGRKK